MAFIQPNVNKQPLTSQSLLTSLQLHTPKTLDPIGLNFSSYTLKYAIHVSLEFFTKVFLA